MKEVFISYSTIDTVSAETVRNVLEKNGLSCWMAPRDIPGGSNYTKEIPIAIRNCKVFVLILSENAQNSHWVLKELDSAVNCGKVILPFMLEDCVLNDEFNFLLTGAQRYSAYQKKAEAMETLIGRIRGILAASAPSDGQKPDRQTPPEEQPQEKETVEPLFSRKKPQEKPAAPLPFTGAVCIACGSADLKPLPKRVKRQGIKELLTMLWIPVLSIVIGFVALLVLVTWWYYDAIWLALVAMIGGGIWGDHISKTIVRRNRIRHRIQSTCYRCNRCSKVFRYDEELEP